MLADRKCLACLMFSVLHIHIDIHTAARCAAVSVLCSLRNLVFSVLSVPIHSTVLGSYSCLHMVIAVCSTVLWHVIHLCCYKDISPTARFRCHPFPIFCAMKCLSPSLEGTVCSRLSWPAVLSKLVRMLSSSSSTMLHILPN